MIEDLVSLIRQSFVSPNPLEVETDGIVIYGAGNCGRDLASLLRRRRVPVRCFLDRAAKPGDAWNGIPIFRMDDEVLSPAERERVQVIIAIFNRDTHIPYIKSALQRAGYRKITTFVESFDYFADDLGDRYWLTSRGFYRQHEADIIRASEVWHDEPSRRLFLSLIRFRLTGDWGALPLPTREDKYFPVDLPPWPVPIRLIDCGAYEGDTVAKAIEQRGRLGAVAAFEPDYNSFAKLAEFTRGSQLDGIEVYLWPCAVHSRTCTMRFSANASESSCLQEDGSHIVQCVALDDVIRGFHPTLITLDVEGAEQDALIGARRIISESRPGLAVCLYHRPEHLWQIPLMIREWGYNYRFYMRSHAFTGFELVMYAIPDVL